MSRRVSMRDVAKSAGVSSSTVSYVINQSKDQSISRETIQRVMDTVEQLGYVPNHAARTLGFAKSSRMNKSHMIGVVIPQTEPGKEFMFSNPFYGDFLSAVEYTARTRGYHLLISGTDVDQSYMDIAKTRSLDGIIILGIYPASDIQVYRDSTIPVVLVDCYQNDYYFHQVGTNDRYGSFLATKHLLDCGHRNIAFVSGSVAEQSVGHARLQGYKDALRDGGIGPEGHHLFIGDVSYQYGIQAAKSIVAAEKGITAAHATADIMALGLLKGFSSCGFSVPEDFSVVGFDDIYMSELCNPGLSTIHQNITQKGRQAAELIIGTAENPDLPKQDIVIPLSLVERGSVRSIL